MRLPFPIRIPVWPALLFTSLLLLLEQLEHTDPIYSGLVFCFFMLSVFAFNVAGGFSRPSGAYIFFYSLLVVDFGTVYKAFLGEPANSNLQNPRLMMGAYVCSIAGMLLAAFLSRRIATTTDGVAGVLHVRQINYFESSLGCFVIFLLMTYAPLLIPGLGGQLLHSLEIINPFLPLSILLGTVAAVQDSGGRRSTNIVVIASLGFSTFLGTLSFSKQGIFTGFVCWVVAMAWARFRLRPIHIIAVISFAIFSEMVLVPIANVGRDEIVEGASMSDRAAVVEDHLLHIPELRAQYNSWEPPPSTDMRMYYYNKPQGFWDRLSMMPNDSVLMEFTNEGHLFGFLALRFYFENWVPHLIDPHKLEGILVGGNAYMHEMGEMSDEDTTTGISFSPTAEAFHIDSWRGVLLILPLVMLMFFVIADATCGDIRRQPLGMFYILICAHLAPEALLGGVIDGTRLINAGFIFGVFFCGYVTPIVGMLLRGQSRDQGERHIHPMSPRALIATGPATGV